MTEAIELYREDGLRQGFFPPHRPPPCRWGGAPLPGDAEIGHATPKPECGRPCVYGGPLGTATPPQPCSRQRPAPTQVLTQSPWPATSQRPPEARAGKGHRADRWCGSARVRRGLTIDSHPCARACAGQAHGQRPEGPWPPRPPAIWLTASLGRASFGRTLVGPLAGRRIRGAAPGRPLRTSCQPAHLRWEPAQRDFSRVCRPGPRDDRILHHAEAAGFA